jgi:hypothetical protein
MEGREACMKRAMVTLGVVCLCLVWACGDDDDEGTEADRLGVGAICSSNNDCLREGDGGVNLSCLMQFKGGYCGLEDCASYTDCPEGSDCVTHDDGNNYCFRLCGDKPECNLHRSLDNEANCSSSIDYAAEALGKACVPPSSGD